MGNIYPKVVRQKMGKKDKVLGWQVGVGVGGYC